MTLQDIIAQLQNMGFGSMSRTSDIADIDHYDIGAKLRDMYGLTPSQLPSTMFQGSTITSPMMQAVLQKTYSPQIEAQSQTLLSDLMKRTTGKNIRQAAGGFAGSGQMQDYMSGARDVYGKGMSGVLSNVQAQKAQGLQNVSDIIKGWHEAAQSIAS